MLIYDIHIYLVIYTFIANGFISKTFSIECVVNNNKFYLQVDTE